MDYLKYDKLEISQYMKSPLFNSTSVQMLLCLRTRTVRGVRNDFRGMYQDVLCPLGCGDIDTLSNILTCQVLKTNMTSSSIATDTIQYSDVFSTDVVKQKHVIEAYSQLLEICEKLMSSLPVANTGPMH